ncbi:MAG: PEGA domain-containing protein [Patescibacteria group bacterium]
MLRRIIYTTIFVAALGATIAYSRGYRINILQNEVTSNGLVAATSTPKSAKIYIDGVLKGVTDTTLYLQPGTYTFNITKDGYFPWTKTITVKGEIVHSIDAILYPTNSSLTPLTNIGIMKAIRFGVGEQKALIFSKKMIQKDPTSTPTPTGSSNDEPKDGLFVFDPNVRAVTLFSSLISIADYSSFPVEINPDNVEVIFSPNFEQAIIINMDEGQFADWNKIKRLSSDFSPDGSYPQSYTSAYLISLSNNNPSPLDVTDSAPTLLNAWTQKKLTNLNSLLSAYKKPLNHYFAENTVLLDFSQDKNRVLYIATAEASLQKILKEPLIGSNQTTDVREVKPNNLYVYDIKEDRNYRIFDEKELTTHDSKQIFFHPNSKNIVFKNSDSIAIADYDAKNIQNLYSGPFNKDFLAISNDGRLIILTNLNPTQNTYGDLYAIGIK